MTDLGEMKTVSVGGAQARRDPESGALIFEPSELSKLTDRIKSLEESHLALEGRVEMLEGMICP